MTLHLPLEFEPDFADAKAKDLYMYAIDIANNRSGWQKMGAWTVTTSPVGPASRSDVLDFSDWDVRPGETVLFTSGDSDAKRILWRIDGRRKRGSEVFHTFDKRGVHDIRLEERFGDGSRRLSSNLLLVGERLIKAGDVLTWDESKVPVRSGGIRLEAMTLMDSVRHPVIARVQGQMVAGTRLVFDRVNARNYKFIALGENEDLERWVWVLGEVVDGETTVLEDLEMLPVAGESTLVFILDSENSRITAALSGELLFRSEFSSALEGGLALIPPATQGRVDIILTRRAH
jgi:hypothetical protein